jgi:hypothetical protein
MNIKDGQVILLHLLIDVLRHGDWLLLILSDF